MRFIIWLVLLFVVAVVAAMSLGANDGLVSFYWRGWRLDLSLNLFIIGVVALAIAVGGSVRFTRWITGLPRRAKAWREGRREQALQSAQREALIEFVAARYSRSVKAAQRAQQLLGDRQVGGGAADGEPSAWHEAQAVNRLLAALALHRLRDVSGRDEQLRLIDATPAAARSTSLNEGLALLKAEWALDDHDARACLQHLEQLQPGVGRRIQAQRLRMQAHRLESEPAEALRSARLLAKHQAFKPEAARSLLRSLAMAVLDTARDAETIQAAWMNLEREDRQDIVVMAHAVTRAARFGAGEWARRILKTIFDGASELSLEERQSVALALVKVVEGVEVEWLALLEPLVVRHAREPAICAAAAVVYAERQLWGKAQPLLEQTARAVGLPLDVRREAYCRLARMADDQGDASRAAEAYRLAAELR